MDKQTVNFNDLTQHAKTIALKLAKQGKTVYAELAHRGWHIHTHNVPGAYEVQGIPTNLKTFNVQLTEDAVNWIRAIQKHLPLTQSEVVCEAIKYYVPRILNSPVALDAGYSEETLAQWANEFEVSVQDE